MAKVIAVVVACTVWVATVIWLVLAVEFTGSLSGQARSTGNDAEWLGHAWVDGRKGQSDVDLLAEQLRDTGIRDLFVHTGPFRDDGTLDATMRPQARWLTEALHKALPGIRVQAWLGAHPVPEELHLDSTQTRAAILVAVGQILDEGFDGIHYDFEPVDEGDELLLTMLRETRELTRRRGSILSVSAIHTEPWGGAAAIVTALPGRRALWSGDYLRRVSQEVDQVAVMAYDTGLPTQATYGGYMRRITEIALAVVPPEVTLFIGLPAYHDKHLFRRDGAETVAAALRGIRLALGDQPTARPFGVALYVDFAATEQDWASYRGSWSAAAKTAGQ